MSERDAVTLPPELGNAFIYIDAMLESNLVACDRMAAEFDQFPFGKRYEELADELRVMKRRFRELGRLAATSPDLLRVAEAWDAIGLYHCSDGNAEQVQAAALLTEEVLARVKGEGPEGEGS